MERTLSYLNKYREQLATVNTANDLYGRFFDWQHSQTSHVKHAQEMINTIFFPNQADAKRLDPDQPPTTAIGGFNKIVIFSANPHYSQRWNSVEKLLRQTALGNRRFCEEAFNVAHADQLAHTQSIQWWQNAANFAFHSVTGQRHEVVTRAAWNALEKQVRPTFKEFRLQHLWNWAHDNRSVGASDVLPFHSNEDGMTGLIEDWEDCGAQDPASNVKRSLFAIATETFKMVLRFRPRLILVVSKAGATVADKVMTALQPAAARRDDVICPVKSNPPWNHEHRYKLHHFLLPAVGVQDTHVLTIPNQLFSARVAQNGLGEVRTNMLPTSINALLG